MKRFLIFTVLFPPLALAVFVAPDAISSRDFMEVGLLVWMLGFAYLFAVVPAWLTAGVDWALSAKPFYFRLVATMVVAAILAELIARSLGQRGEVLTFGLMGAIPAAVCSWMSRLIQPSRRAVDALTRPPNPDTPAGATSAETGPRPAPRR